MTKQRKPLTVIFLVLLFCAAARGERPVRQLRPLPPGTWLPVSMKQTVAPGRAHPGERISAQLMQRVPLPHSRFLPPAARLSGRVVSVSRDSIGITFDQLEWHGQTIPVRVRLLALAQWFDVEQSRNPLAAPDRGTDDPSQWTTRQVGGDVVYRANWYGPVENRYSEKVGEAGPNGVYANPSKPGGLPLALGPFSTGAHGVYGTDDLKIAPAAGAGGAIVIHLTKPHAKLHLADALLLEVTP